MNIAIDVRCLMEKERSGVGEYTYQLLDRWCKEVYDKKLDYEFFLFYNSFRDLRSHLPQWNYPFVHYCGFHWPNKLLNFCLKFLKYPKLDKLLLTTQSFSDSRESENRIEGKRIDYFIFPNQNFYALSRGVKKIIVVHDLSGELYPECFSLKSRLWHKAVNLRAMVQGADKIIAVSENTKLDIINFYKIDPVKITVIYPEVITPTYPPPLQRGRNKEGDYILFLGTIEPRKNVLGLLKAYEHLYGHCEERGDEAISQNSSREIAASATGGLAMTTELPELWIAGKAGYKSKEVFEFWKTMKSRDRVKFLGYVDEKKKWELLRGARAFVCPSFYEGFGMPVLEAMSIGTPVITSSTSSMHEIVGNAGMLVDPNRVEEIAQAIQFLIDDEGLCKELSEKARWRATSFQSIITPTNLFP